MGDWFPAATAACILVCLTIMLAYWQKKRGGSSNKGALLPLPPGPRGWPIVGNLPELGDKLHEDLFHLARKYGPLMSLQLGRKTAVVVSSPEMARQFLKANDAAFSSRAIPEAVRMMTYDATSLVFVPYGDRWRLLRKVLTAEVFSSGSLQALEPLRRSQVDAMLAAIYRDCRQPVGIAAAAFAAAANLVSHVVSSRDAFESEGLKAALSEMLRVVGSADVSDLFPVLRRLDLQGHRRRVATLYRRLDRYFDRLVLERQRGGARRGKRDLLDALLEHRHPDGRRFSPTDIKGVLSDMFVAGTDTTSSTVEWGMTEILRNPEAVRRIRAEMEEAVGVGEKVRESDIGKLPYLQAAVKEVFRLHPGVPLLIPRRADAACRIGGFLVPEGATVLVNVWGMGRDPEVWGSNPREFRPERFLGSDVDVRGHHFELLPFGAGRRACAGMPLGYRMVQLLLASLLHSFHWSAPPHLLSDLSERAGMTLQKANPLVAVPTPRLPHNLYC